jgi:hypothetical protein
MHMDLSLATLKAVSFYLLHNISTLNQSRKFSCVTVVCKHPGTHLSCTMGTGSFPGVKRPGRGADHALPCSAEVKTEYSYTSTTSLGPWWPFTAYILLYLLQFCFSLMSEGNVA